MQVTSRADEFRSSLIVSKCSSFSLISSAVWRRCACRVWHLRRRRRSWIATARTNWLRPRPFRSGSNSANSCLAASRSCCGLALLCASSPIPFRPQLPRIHQAITYVRIKTNIAIKMWHYTAVAVRSLCEVADGWRNERSECEDFRPRINSDLTVMNWTL